MIKCLGNKILRRFDKELLCIEPWGENSFRVRATQRHEFLTEDNGALLDPAVCESKVYKENGDTVLVNGKLRCEITPTGKLRFKNNKGELLLEEYERIREEVQGRKEFNSALEIVPRTFEPHPNTDNYRLMVRFEPNEGEKLYGCGQYQQPYLDVKGCTLELAHRNSQASIPFVLSNKGYGMLWNNPAIGYVTFGKNVTEWTAHSTRQMDYWITAGDSPSEIEEAYANATGKVPMMPEYGMGFWQCKLRYQTQDEIMEVAREYKRRGLPISVIVVDFFHWPNQGDWKFDLDYWPDPKKMVDELKEMGIELMVSIWPTVDAQSENYKEMEELGYLTRSEYGKRIGQLGDACVIDPTNPEARAYVWNKIRQNYYDLGIKIFWLDEAEPEFTGYEYSHYRYFKGADMEVGNIYPREYAKMAYEGMEAEGQENIVNLLRCAWAGSQKYGALVWSGDIDSSFRSMRNQLAAGLNMGLSGIPWWTTDIGGFHGGNIQDDKFKECLIRWFEFGAFCPVFRLHGFREPFKEALGTTGGGKHISGAENEVWSYGEEVLSVCTKYMELREKMKPYITRIMKEAHEKGTPVMRPLFYDFPQDNKCWDTEDEYMFGPDLLVAPVLYENERQRKVYLPDGKWRNIHDNKEYQGGQEINVNAPIDEIPVFVREGSLEEIC
ncbi:TIM-barrel domain-containing protein [Robinsoniella peoriensis]|nr:glycoside hydrolase family 31 protein [Robinsoniella peoriensis]MDU7027120.1 glycoside hydrolase family 31 protein [Clostridiales bacterium]